MNQEVIDLQPFWTSYAGFKLYDNEDGDAVVDLTNLNNQTITLLGVSVSELGSQHFIGVTGLFNEALLDAIVPSVDELVGDSIDTTLPDAGSEVTLSEQGQAHIFTWLWGSESIVNDFNVEQDTIDLQSFWTSYDSFTIYNNAFGDAVIDLMELNNQTIILSGVSVEELTANNIRGVSGNFVSAVELNSVAADPVSSEEELGLLSPEVLSFTWNWGSRDVIENFDVNQDIVDLRAFWASEEQVPVYDDASGNAVIDLLNLNNQTITLVGVSADELGETNLLF